MKRREAIALGLDRYFTGKPCKHGHVAERLLPHSKCVECCSPAPVIHSLSPRAAAIERGEKRYFTGKPCPHGHIAHRLVKNSECVKCHQRAAVARRSKSDTWRENRRAQKAARRARKRACDVSVTSSELASLRAKHGKRCAYCGVRGRMTIDHIKPLALGGQHIARNIQFLCHSCNSAKGKKAPEDFARSRGLLL